MHNFIKLNFNKEMKSYLSGFLFSLFLTLVPFLLIMKSFFSNEIVSYIVILFCATSQIFVHFIYFLHLNFSSEQRWNLVTLLFIIMIIFIVVFGSIWIMFNLNHHIM